MTEILPELPEPPRALERAYTCDGWIEIPAGERPTCARCVGRLERYRQVAAGHGTVLEIREALAALETLRGQTPLGQCVRVVFEGLRIWACPRSIDVGDETPLIAVARNRAERRRVRLTKKRAR